jgi:hypothetical protein
MSTEPQVTTGEVTEINAPVSAPVTTEVATPETDANPELEASPEEDDATKALKRMQRRIDKRTADVYRERAENEQLKQRLAALEAKDGPKEETQTVDPYVLAKDLARADRFAEMSNQLVDAGTKKHSDYMHVLKDLSTEVGEFVKRDGKPSPFMEVVIEVAETPQRRAELLYHLGKNPDIAADLADLNPIQLAKRLDRLERELTDSSKPKTSNAPKPLEPVKGKASDSDLGPGLSDAEWMKRREAQIKEARGR